jgi:hypothetical protein
VHANLQHVTVTQASFTKWIRYNFHVTYKYKGTSGEKGGL